jgi:CHAD domain-containing protein
MQRSGQAREALDSTRYFRLLDALDALVAQPPLTSDAQQPATTALPYLLHRDLKRLRRAVRSAWHERQPDERDEAMHEARKKAKRLRYAAETASPVLGKPAKRLARRAKRVQQELGVRQDTVLSRKVLRDLAVRSHLNSENAFTFGRLHALEERHAVEAEDRFHAAWKKLRRDELPS